MRASAASISPRRVLLLLSSLTHARVAPARASLVPPPVDARHGRSSVRMTSTAPRAAHYRRDGVRIQHDPYAPGMAEKYGAPGATDSEGFDPYADSVGAGIYGGRVKRDPATGDVAIGAQFQGHNPRPGPMYAGGGYTPVSNAIASFSNELATGVNASETTLGRLLARHPDLANDVSTGGASPLHTCGMSRANQHATAFLLAAGADPEALDTYGYTPLDRMASNNLAVGAEALLTAGGADPESAHGGSEGPERIAAASEARDALEVIRRHKSRAREARAASAVRLRVFAPGRGEVSGTFERRPGSVIPVEFGNVCAQNGWDPAETWAALNGGADGDWFLRARDGDGEYDENGAYAYRNAKDGKWWIDGPDGLGVFTARGPAHAVPGMATAWEALDENEGGLPTVLSFRESAGIC